MIVREIVLRVNLQSLVIICDCIVVVSITKIDVGSMYESVGTGVKRHRACRELSGSRELLCSRETPVVARSRVQPQSFDRSRLRRRTNSSPSPPRKRAPP